MIVSFLISFEIEKKNKIAGNYFFFISFRSDFNCKTMHVQTRRECDYFNAYRGLTMRGNYNGIYILYMFYKKNKNKKIYFFERIWNSYWTSKKNTNCMSFMYFCLFSFLFVSLWLSLSIAPCWFSTNWMFLFTGR